MVKEYKGSCTLFIGIYGYTADSSATIRVIEGVGTLKAQTCCGNHHRRELSG